MKTERALACSGHVILGLLILPMTVFGQSPPAGEHLPELTIECEVERDCPPMGAVVTIGIHVAQPSKGHLYVLRYEVRVQEQAGVLGPLLGDASFPKGVSYDVDNSEGKELARDGSGNFNLKATIDMTREKLRGMTNWPDMGQQRKVVVAIEPHVYDKTASLYVTPPSLSPAFLLVTMDESGKVKSLQSYEDWVWNFSLQFKRVDFPILIDTLSRLGDFDPVGRQLPRALARMLEGDDLKPEDHLALLRAMRPEWVLHGKLGLESGLAQLLEELGAVDDAETQKEVKRLLSGGD
ncbi:hypothetical protein Pla52n_69710 [Stieleria varia]|uniref:Uncharacterized protein n=2 Tax=Stieleria varia TaxID=2528005 RepID=A0A5C5ZK95_9BACT|nr:hypothetical protein Pla52n_69710 [Stieleria varia]